MPTAYAFDTETTGLDRGSRLVALAVQAFDTETGEVLQQWDLDINPEMPIPPDVTAINGATDETVADAWPAGNVLAELFGEILEEGSTLIGHYAMFDTGIISWDAARFGITLPAGITVIDTCEMAKSLRQIKSNSLDALVEHYKIKRLGQGHRALSDADACRQYFMIAKRNCVPVARPWADAGHDYAYADALPSALEGLPELVSCGGPFAFEYCDKDGATTRRTITPYGWASKGGSIYFHGLCHLRKERRTFLADRVVRTMALPL